MELCFLFLCQLGLFHFFLPRAPEGVLLIRAVSPATPQGSVSQPDSDTHIYTGPHTHIHKKQPNAASTHTHPYPYHVACVHTRTHTHTDIHSFILLLFWHLIPEGEQLKDAPLSPHFSIPSNSPCHLYLRLPFPLTLSLAAPLSWQVIWW